MKTYQDKNSPLYANLPFMKIRGEVPQFPCVAELKLDGEFQYVISHEGQVYLANKREHGRIRTDMTVTDISLPNDTVLIGELFYGDGKSFYDFARHKLTDDLNLNIFGVLRVAGKDVWKDWNYVDSRRWLEQQKFYTSRTALVPKFILQDRHKFEDVFDTVSGCGYEGLILKGLLSKYANGDSKEWLKRKTEHEEDLAVIGFQAGTKRAKNLSLLVGRRVNGVLVPFTHVGGGLTDRDKALFLAELVSIGNNKDDQLVEPKFVVRVRHNGIIYDEDGNVNSLRHPRVITNGDVPWREDKTVDEV